jgi:hypothetical protein
MPLSNRVSSSRSSSIAAKKVSTDGGARGLLKIALVAFLLTCVFDPADRVLGAKVLIFFLCWVCAVGVIATTKERVVIPFGLFVFTYLFTLIPLLSVLEYLRRGGGDPFYGFALLKGYMLITFALLLVMTRVSLVRQLSLVLSFLAFVVIVVFLLLLIAPDLYVPIYIFGEATGIVQLDIGRDYGGDVVLMQVYFVTSPMLVISIAYYFDRMRSTLDCKMKALFFGLMLLSIAGMILAGSRNNIVIAALLPIALWVNHTRRKALGVVLGTFAVIALIIVFKNQLSAFFDSDEISNSVKLAMLKEYSKLFEDPNILLFGQGLGAFHNWEGRGSIPVTELTYHEMLRNFGIFGTIIMMILLLFPILHAFLLNRQFKEKAIIIAYVGYLIMSASNPLMFSSMGTLILSIILYMIYRPGIKE